jgi:hypothetical protein
MDERKCGVPLDDSERGVGQPGRQGRYQRIERGRMMVSWILERG